MPSVTVLGVGHEIITLNYDSTANANIAAMIAAAISHGVETGSVAPVNGGSGSIQIPPPVPAGKTGEFVQKHDGLSIMLPGYKDVVVTAGVATVLGSGDANEAILSSEGDLTFIATGGSGTVVAGGAAPSQSRGNDESSDGDRGHRDKNHGDRGHGAPCGGWWRARSSSPRGQAEAAVPLLAREQPSAIWADILGTYPKP